MSDVKSAYFHRIIVLVIDTGTETLRDLFYNEVPRNSVANIFTTNKIAKEFIRLKQKGILTQIQYDKLTNCPDPDTYDISLLVTLLRTKKVCPRIQEPVGGWSQEPADNDQTVGADLFRLRELRNSIVGHRTSAQLEKHEFESLKNQIKEILIRLAKHVSPQAENKVKTKIEQAEKYALLPLEDREKKLLDVFLDWYKQDTEKYQQQLQSVQSSLQNLHIKVDSLSCPTDTTDSSTVDTSDSSTVDVLASIHSQVSSLVESIKSIDPCKQGTIDQMKETIETMGSDLKKLQEAIQQLTEMFLRNQNSLQALSRDVRRPGNQTAEGMDQTDAVRDPVRTDSGHSSRVMNPHITIYRRQNVTNPDAMSDKELLTLSKQIGFEWESLRIHLDITEAQNTALMNAFRDSVQERIYKMLKAWHDVVVECGENPKMLLAAAFVQGASNYRMAYKLVSREQLDVNACARSDTIQKIQNIEFRKDGYRRGDCGPYEEVRTYSPGSAFNVYGGNVQFEGNLSLHSGASFGSSETCLMSHGSASRESGNCGSHGFFNVHGGNVIFTPQSNVAIGPPAGCFTVQSSYSQTAVRGETQGLPDQVRPSSSSSSLSSSSSGQPYKKEYDNTLSQSMMAALHEQMKSVGVLICYNNVVGTVFRVGSKFVMTACHVVRMAIDPSNSGMYDLSRLEDQRNIKIHFNEALLSDPTRYFFVKRDFAFSEELDVAILEIANPEGLPRKMVLCKHEVNLSDVSLVGYGNPKNTMKKYLDPRCPVVQPGSPRVSNAMVWLQQNRLRFKNVLREIGEDSQFVDLGYCGFDKPSRIVFDCYMEHGASGAPVLTNSNERSIQVVGMLTHGLPEFYFKLPDDVQRQVPCSSRLEVGTKMKSIYEWIYTEHQGIVQDLFN